MALSPKVRAVAAGVLVANSAPHLATAVTGRRHLTPLAGRDSSPAVNLAWAAANLIGGTLLLRDPADMRHPGRWDDRLVAFEAGYLAWALWMTLSEYLLRVNWAPPSGAGC
jgi:hypothetical protein